MSNAKITAFIPALVLFAGMGRTVPVFAQFGPLADPMYAPEAKTEEELDLYLELAASANPQESVKTAEHFAAAYPQSELLGLVYEYEMHAYERLDNFKGVLQAGEQALRLQPDNVDTQLTLANFIPDHVVGRADSSKLLQEAEGYARASLRELGTMHVPREISPERWKTLRGQLEAHAHEALGKIERDKGNLPASISEFALAALRNPIPQGMQFYYLGRAYALSGQREEAGKALRRAATLGPDNVREMAQHELARIGGDKVKH